MSLAVLFLFASSFKQLSLLFSNLYTISSNPVYGLLACHNKFVVEREYIHPQ